LFGRVVEDLQLAARAGATAKRAARSASLEPQGPSHDLADQVAAEGSCLARIYAFSYEGGYFDLARPALYLVHGPGEEISKPIAVETSGIAATPDDFASDLKVWAYDKADLSIRLDVDTGTLEQILLERELQGDRTRQASGFNVRSSSSGFNVRSSTSGFNVRLRGNRDPSAD
jgi:hypothetical protein